MPAVLLAGSTLGVMGGAVLVPALEVIRGDFGVSGTAAGFALTAHGPAIAVTSPLVGRLVVYGLAGGAGLVVTSYPALIAPAWCSGRARRRRSRARRWRCRRSTRARSGTG